jgi:hypothetical protein
MKSIIIITAIVIIWVLLQKVILPRLGIAT